MEKNSSFQWFGIKKAWEQLMGVPILFWPIALPVIVVTADTDSNSAQLKGEEWQRGNQQRGSLIRFGGSLNSDDLRHRLNELRSSKSGGPERRTPKTGGHYAKQ